ERPLCATSGHRTHTGSERSIASHGLKSKAVLHSAGSPVLLGAIPGAALLIERVYEVDRDSDLHAQKRVAFAKETAKHRRALANIASNRNGDKIAPPTLRCVGSKVIQPAPGTKTSAQAWVEPASAEPARSWFGSCR